jgi:hypothetical protein
MKKGRKAEINRLSTSSRKFDQISQEGNAGDLHSWIREKLLLPNVHEHILDALGLHKQYSILARRTHQTLGVPHKPTLHSSEKIKIVGHDNKLTKLVLAYVLQVLDDRKLVLVIE